MEHFFYTQIFHYIFMYFDRFVNANIKLLIYSCLDLADLIVTISLIVF